jgi:recombination protein RecT
MKDGGVQFEVMSRSEIDGIRSRSKSSGSGPWVTDYPEMARKTVLRRLCKYLPMSSELASAMESEESEGDFVITNLETGESIDLKPQITQADVNTSQVDSALSEALAKIRDTGESPELVLDCDIDNTG